MNPNRLLPHALWGIIAAGAFAGGLLTGKNQSPTASDPASAASASGNSSPAATPWRQGSPADKNPGAPGADTLPAANVLPAAASTPLTADAMRATLADILKESDPLKKNRLFAELMEQLTPENIEAAVVTLRDSGLDPMNFRDMALLTYAWGKMDPAKAMDYAENMDGRGQAFVHSSILAGWASQNPDAAMEWFEQNGGDGWQKNMMARGLIEGLVQKDPDAATRLAMQQTDPEMAGQFFDAIARNQLRDKGVEATRAWIDRLLASGSVASENLAGATGELAGKLAANDPRGATEWALGLPDGEAKFNAVEESISTWGRKDPTAASAYLAAMPASETKDRAIQDFSSVIAREDPQAAATWAASIQDPDRRERTMVRAAREWYQRDSDAATNWAKSSGLSAESIERISRPPERGRGGPPMGRVR